MKKRIVITGIGVVSPIGTGKENFWNALEEGRSGIKPITLFDTSKYKVKVGGEVSDFDPKVMLGPKGLRDLDRATKLLLCSTKLALEDAKLKITEENSSKIGVSVGTTLGSLSSISRFNQESFTQGPRFTNPSLFPSTVGNSPASQAGIKFNIRGFNATLSTGMCASLDALDYICDFILTDKVKSGIAGSVEDLSIQTFLGCYKLHYLSGLNGNADAPLSRPFDKRRDGIVLGEGAVTLLVEELEEAKKRKAVIYAEILGIASCFDPGKYYKFKLQGSGMVEAMKIALDNARLKPDDIDCIFANANSTKDADKAEIRAIKKVFPDRDVAVTAVKSFTGETFSVSGGLSLVAALGSLQRNFIPATVNFTEKDPECSFRSIVTEKLAKETSRIMINTFSPYGANTVAIIGRYGKDN